MCDNLRQVFENFKNNFEFSHDSYACVSLNENITWRIRLLWLVISQELPDHTMQILWSDWHQGLWFVEIAFYIINIVWQSNTLVRLCTKPQYHVRLLPGNFTSSLNTQHIKLYIKHIEICCIIHVALENCSVKYDT